MNARALSDYFPLGILEAGEKLLSKNPSFFDHDNFGQFMNLVLSTIQEMLMNSFQQCNV